MSKKKKEDPKEGQADSWEGKLPYPDPVELSVELTGSGGLYLETIEIADLITATGQEVREAVSRGASPEEIGRIVEKGLSPIRERSPTPIRMPKTLQQEILRTQEDRARGGKQLRLWDELSGSVQRELDRTGTGDIVRTSGLQPMVDLTPEEQGLKDAIYSYLKLWEGTMEGQEVQITAGDLARIYYARRPSGADLKRVESIAVGLSMKVFEFTGTIATKSGTTGMKERRYVRLFNLIRREIWHKGKNATMLIFQLDSCLTHIGRQYIELPGDICERTIKAFPGRGSIVAWEIRTFLLNEVSSNRQGPTVINMDNAFSRFCPQEMKPYRKRERIEDALRGYKEMGLIKSWSIDTGAEGQQRYVILLEKNWARQPARGQQQGLGKG